MFTNNEEMTKGTVGAQFHCAKASRSLAALLLGCVALLALPQAASAQSTCTPTPDTGAGTNDVGYTDGNHNSGVTCSATGVLTVNNTGNSSIRGAVDFSGSVDGVIFTNHGPVSTFGSDGSWQATGDSFFTDSDDVVSFLNEGVHTLEDGSINFGDGDDVLTADTGNFNTGEITQFLRQYFQVTNGVIDFGAGDDTFNASGIIYFGNDLGNPDDGLSFLDFGTGDDTLHLFNAAGSSDAGDGTLVLSADVDFGEGDDTFFNDNATLVSKGVNTVDNLETFHNDGGLILLGGSSFLGLDLDKGRSDARPDDALRMPDTVFVGSGDGRVVIDANLGNEATSQLDCSTAGAADCLHIAGSAGETKLTVRDTSFNVNAGRAGTVVTLVEGSSAAEHFVLDPESLFYSETTDGGTAIKKPVVQYLLSYDEPTQRHVLLGVPNPEMYEVGTYAAAAQETWRATTGSWLTRQADLRATPGGLETSRGAWGKFRTGAGERDIGTTLGLPGGLSLDYDLAHEQKTTHVVLGADFLGASDEDSAWVAGGMIGYARSKVDYEATPTVANFTGVTGGFYASYVAGPLFVDAVVNLNDLHVTAKVPAINLSEDGNVPMVFDLTSLGGQVEAGWRIDLGSGLFVEPLAGVSYVVTEIKDTDMPGSSSPVDFLGGTPGTFAFEDAKSLRVGGGARLGLASALAGVTANYSFTARYWNESEGENEATVATPGGDPIALPDDFSGGFTDVSAGLELFSASGDVSGFVNLDGKFGDDYESVGLSTGVRLRW